MIERYEVGITYMFRRCDKDRRTLEYLCEDRNQLLEEDGICRSSAQKVYIVAQFRRNTQLELHTYTGLSAELLGKIGATMRPA